MYTLNATEVHGVAIGIDQQGGKGQANFAIEKSPTLAAESHGTPHAVCYSIGHDERAASFTPNKADTLTASDYKQPTIIFREGSYSKWERDNVCGTLRSTGGTLSGGSESLAYQKNVGALCMDDYKGANNQYVDQDKCVVNNKTVRRLVPLECERLMGLPDNYTNVEFNGKPAPDSKRYKAIGNGMAVPNSDFIMRRIAEVNANGQNEGHD
jgi:DNA (cytosine-5)-methyltransferase 1